MLLIMYDVSLHVWLVYENILEIFKIMHDIQTNHEIVYFVLLRM
jgi:hypothetical protein